MPEADKYRAATVFATRDAMETIVGGGYQWTPLITLMRGEKRVVHAAIEGLEETLDFIYRGARDLYADRALVVLDGDVGFMPNPLLDTPPDTPPPFADTSCLVVLDITADHDESVLLPYTVADRKVKWGEQEVTVGSLGGAEGIDPSESDPTPPRAFRHGIAQREPRTMRADMAVIDEMCAATGAQAVLFE